MAKVVDHRRKVTEAKAKKMTEMLSKGKSYKTVADKFGVSVYAVKYNTDPHYAAAERIRKSA